MAPARDIVILGGGHNALVTAFYLAKKGFKPLILERRAIIGGAAVTEEFHPGFRCSTLAHAAGPLLPEIAGDMQLAHHGLKMLDGDLQLFAPTADGRALRLYKNEAESMRSIGFFSKPDAGKYRELQQSLGSAGAIVRDLISLTPPVIEKPTGEDVWKFLKVGRKVRGLGKRDMMRLLRWGPMAVADFAAEFFQTDLLRGIVAARGIFGAALGPWSAGSTALLLLRSAVDPSVAGNSAHPIGGMGALTAALAAAASKAGAEIRTSAEVGQILVKSGAATGVVLSTGEQIAATAVVSGADPRRTFLGLLDPVHLPPSFVVKMQHFRAQGTVAKLNLALDALPNFIALGQSQSADAAASLAGRIHIGAGIDYLEHAFDHSKYGEFSRAPYLDVMIPSIGDAALAPAAKHVMSIHMQFAPYRLKQSDWAQQRDTLRDTIIKTLAEYAPDLPGKILAAQTLTPQDLEDSYALTGGHPFHGELALDQIFTMRPLLGWARYRTPVKGLYLCGSGTHPGTGLTGASGANAAREILRDLRK